jgi:hypothetical protein
VSQQRANILAFPQMSIVFKGKKRKKLLKDVITAPGGESTRTAALLSRPRRPVTRGLSRRCRIRPAGEENLGGAGPIVRRRPNGIRCTRRPCQDARRSRQGAPGGKVNACKRRVNILF